MTTTRNDLAKAKLLLLVYSGKECIEDGIWVDCNGTSYKKLIADILVEEGHFEKEEGKYIPYSLYLCNGDNWLE